MKINGINISSFKAELNGRTITENTVTQNLSFNAVMSLVSHLSFSYCNNIIS